MLYPCSPSLQTLPVPGIGFCQSIFVDRSAADRLHWRAWPLIQSAAGSSQVSTDRAGTLPG